MTSQLLDLYDSKIFSLINKHNQGRDNNQLITRD
jgi:hypothetical protein